ncbi:hypothetical protein C8F01DRAFT_1264340 [Mycena amicta]|nr:hypothetical protein C8F01DRAFT_1264340 [Mycena amicta]
MAKERTGVRWTPMHDLLGWDPVKHVLLGWMHNWLEGVLNHHLRVRWGIGRQAYKKELAHFREREDRDDDMYTESDVSEASVEADLWAMEMDHDEAAEEDESEQIPSDPDMSEAQPTPEPEAGTFFGMSFDDDDDDDTDDYIPDPPPSQSVFGFLNDELQFIRNGIRDVKLPTHTDRPPINLGEAQHGKLKAPTVLVLFSVIFPLIIPVLWWGKGELQERLLWNLHDLVACTNILASYQTTSQEADRFRIHYIRYRKTLALLFPFFSNIPNHHYAMHYPELLKFWGPMSVLSEFLGERMNGILGKVKTNRRLYDMPLTMLKFICRWGRLRAFLSENHGANTFIGRLADILQKPTVNTTTARILTDQEVADMLGDVSELPDVHYTLLLQYLQGIGQSWRSFKLWPHPPGVDVLYNRANIVSQLKRDDEDYVCRDKHKSNSAIQFKNPLNAPQATSIQTL